MATIDAPPAKSEGLRYRLYFWLMNVCLFFAAAGLIDWLVDPFEAGEWPVWYIAFAAIVLPFNTLVPLFLMVAKFMRDDYAESLWRRSLVVMAYGVAVVPALIFAIPWILYLSFSALGLAAPPGYREFYEFMVVRQFGANVVLYKAWLTFMLLFVGVFQFLRWRDSR